MIDRSLILFTKLISKSHWLHVVLTRRTVDDLFSAFGKIWLIIAVTSFFFTNAKPYLSQNPYLLIGTMLSISLWVGRPRLTVSTRLKNCDIDLEIRVGSLFNLRGAYVVSTNTTFDTDINAGIISKNSLQGQLTSKFYSDDIAQLDSDLERLLRELAFEQLAEPRLGKSKRYPIGTTLKLNKEEKTFYLVAIANLNEHGTVETSFENIQESLSALWKKIESVGNVEPVIIPLVGSGRCRLKQSRTDFAKEIINSFIVACCDKKLCEKLIIVISPEDYRKYDIDLYQLNEYLKCKCTFPELISK